MINKFSKVIHRLIEETDMFLFDCSFLKEHELEHKEINEYLDRVGLAILELGKKYYGEELIEGILLKEKFVSLLILLDTNTPRHVERLRFLLKYNYSKLRNIEEADLTLINKRRRQNEK